MGRLRHGTSTGMLDIHQNTIKVGDTIRLTTDGSIWDVNSYLQVIPKGDGHARKLREVLAICELVEQADMPTVSEKANEEAPAVLPSLDDFSDEELVAELRKRGVEVKALRQVITYEEL